MPEVSGADLIGALQCELPIPISISELPATGVLGLCVNLITIVHHDEVDPVEHILKAFVEDGVNATCFPGAHDRESERSRQREEDKGGVCVHHF